MFLLFEHIYAWEYIDIRDMFFVGDIAKEVSPLALVDVNKKNP